MPLFRVTKKLATALKVKPPTSFAGPESVEHEWFADLFFVDRKKCVIWVHGPALLAFVRPAVSAAELREFHALFRYEFRTAMASMALSESLLERFDVYGEERYAPTNDRRIVGSMMDYRKMFAAMVELDGGLATADIRSSNVQLSDTPMSTLGMESAIELVRRVAGPAPNMMH
jgi:hypothetical protein